ncbi:hypothetical protein DL93DRAFT_782461 [Clavulina sp. PMI_390]|nr:hypothetical protein DL93DRAFT_782461 [Clavulina sp. PMI_390]
MRSRSRKGARLMFVTSPAPPLPIPRSGSTSSFLPFSFFIRKLAQRPRTAYPLWICAHDDVEQCQSGAITHTPEKAPGLFAPPPDPISTELSGSEIQPSILPNVILKPQNDIKIKYWQQQLIRETLSASSLTGNLGMTSLISRESMIVAILRCMNTGRAR